jgi:hypothetical protein
VREERHTEFRWGRPERNRLLEHLGIHGREVFIEIAWKSMDWIDMAQDTDNKTASSSKRYYS